MKLVGIIKLDGMWLLLLCTENMINFGKRHGRNITLQDLSKITKLTKYGYIYKYTAWLKNVPTSKGSNFWPISSTKNNKGVLKFLEIKPLTSWKKCGQNKNHKWRSLKDSW